MKQSAYLDALAPVGAPGAGKGTLVKNLAELTEEEMQFVHMSTGEMLREERDRGTELGGRVAWYMDRGLLAPDEVVVPVAAGRIGRFVRERKATIRQLLLPDGFPRNEVQAKEYSRILEEKGLRGAAVFLDVPPERFDELAHRIARRAVEDRKAGKKARPDDENPETVATRLANARGELLPVVDHFGERGELFTVDAMQDPMAIALWVRQSVLSISPVLTAAPRPKPSHERGMSHIQHHAHHD